MTQPILPHPKKRPSGTLLRKLRKNLSIDEAGRLIDRLQENVLQMAVADAQVLKLILVTILARGHLLLEDVPGMGKTLVASRLCYSG